MSNSKYFRTKVLTKYASTMKEYFNLMNQSDIIKNLANPNNSLYIGMNSIHRVFEYVLIKTNNIDNAYFYSQKSYYYYLEYLEQINKAELVNSLNHMDAILFIYKKTIFDFYNGEHSDNNNIMNMMSLNDDDLQNHEMNLRELFNKISNFTKTLFFWDNIYISFENRIKICDEYMGRYLAKFDSIELITSYLDIIQQKIDIKFSKYDDLLNEMLMKVEKTRKFETLDESEKNERFLIKFYVEDHIFQEKFMKDNTKDLVKWLFV